MTEKAFKTMGNTGAAALTTGIIMIVTGIACGVLMLISGARLLRAKKELTF